MILQTVAATKHKDIVKQSRRFDPNFSSATFMCDLGSAFNMYHSLI